MSAPQPSAGPIVFDHIPTLKELLPKTGGRPGVEYLQCSAENYPKADADGWKGVSGAKPYVIQNPKTGDQLSMVLLCCGEELKGYSPFSGARVCQVDKLVRERLKITQNGEKAPVLDDKKES